MDQTMRLPFKVSTTTSNFMIGVTAAARTGVFLRAGQIDPTLAFPVMLGVLAGALLGARLLGRDEHEPAPADLHRHPRRSALEMLYKGLRGARLTRDESRWTDHAVEQLIGRFLQFGVMLAAGVVLVGGTLVLVQHGGAPVSYAVFHGAPEQLRTIGGIVRGALALDSKAIVQLGLVLLIATPVARVAFMLIAFVVQRDRSVRRDQRARLGIAPLRVTIGPSMKRHHAVVRITHWVNAIALTIMVGSGLRIFNAYPAFARRGETFCCYPFERRPIPACLTFGGWLAGARNWHFAMMWVLA